jgi:hypothetical protein
MVNTLDGSKVISMVNRLFHRRTSLKGKIDLPDLSDNLELLSAATLDLSDAVEKLVSVVEDLIIIADRPAFNEDSTSSTRDTVADAVKMLDKMRYLTAPETVTEKAPNTQPSATNRIITGMAKRYNHDA